MGREYLPNRDGELKTWSANFSTLISAGPEAYGLTAAQATAYATLNNTFSLALTAALEPGTRTKAAITAKNTAKAALKEAVRPLVSIIQGQTDLSDDQKVLLGITVRKAPAPIPPPDVYPRLDVVSVQGRTVTVRLHDGSPRRAKPTGVATATVLSFVGDTAPDDTGAWKLEGSITRTTFDVTFPATVEPGTTVWITAYWSNPRAQSGPACPPVSVTFGAAAVNNNGTLKLAA